MINDDARQKIKKKISEFCESSFDSEKLLEIEDDIIALDDAELSWFFVQNVGVLILMPIEILFVKVIMPVLCMNLCIQLL